MLKRYKLHKEVNIEDNIFSFKVWIYEIDLIIQFIVNVRVRAFINSVMICDLECQEEKYWSQTIVFWYF